MKLRLVFKVEILLYIQQDFTNGFTAFTNYSDSRLKTNISSLDTGTLSKIMQLRTVSFQYNQKYLQLYPNSDLQKVHKGFIAQEIRQVFPEMVSDMKASPDSVQYLDLDVSHLQVYLVKMHRATGLTLQRLAQDVFHVGMICPAYGNTIMHRSWRCVMWI